MVASTQILKAPLRRPSQLLLSITCPMKVDTFAVSANGQNIAGGSGDGCVRVWNLISGALVRWRQFTAPLSMGTAESSNRSEDEPLPVDALAYAWGGLELFCVLDGYLTMLDPETLSPTRHASLPFCDIRCMSVNVNSTIIALGLEDGTVLVFDTQAHAVVRQIGTHSDAVNMVVFSLDGSRLAAASDDKTCSVWEVASGKPIGDPFKGYSSPVCAVAFSPDGNSIATGLWDATVGVWDIASGKLNSATWHLKNPVLFLAFSSDGTRIITAAASKWSWKDFKPDEDVASLSSSKKRCHYIGMYPDGSRGYALVEQTNIELWDANVQNQNRQREKTAGHSSSVRSVAFAPGGSRIASGSRDKTVRVWDAQKGESEVMAEMRHSNSVLLVTFSPNGQYIVSGGFDNVVRIWDALTGHPIQTLEGHPKWIRCGAYSPDGSRFVSGSADGMLRLWDMPNGRLVGEPMLGHADDVSSVSFSPDGLRIASSSQDGTIRFWDGLTGKALGEPLAGHDGPVSCFAFSPDGKVTVSGGMGCTLSMWDVRTRSNIGEPLEGHNQRITCVTFSPDGEHIYSSSMDRTIRCWDTLSGRPVGHPLIGHSDDIWSLAVSQDGRHIVSGARDSTIRIWSSANFHWDSDQSLALCCLLGPEKVPAHIERNGWIRTLDDKLLLWVPDEHRNAACDMSDICISQDEGDKPIRILWDKFQYGDRWMDVWQGP